MARPSKYTPEFRRRAIEEVLDPGRSVTEVAISLAITTPEALRRWVVQAKIDRGLVTGPTTEELAEIKALRKEVAASAIPRRGPPRGLRSATSPRPESATSAWPPISPSA